MKFPFLLSAAGLDAGSQAPAAPSIGADSIALPQTPPGPLDPDFKPSNEQWVPKHPWDTPPKDAPAPEQAPPPEQQAQPQSQTPNILYQDDRGITVLSPDGQYIELYTSDFSRLLTKVQNTPSAIATVIARDKGYIEQLRTAPQQAQQEQAPPPPDPRAEMRSKWQERALKAAQAKYHAIDPEQNVGPLAEVLADLLTEYDAEKTESVTQQTAAERAFQGEIGWVQQMDPTFDFNHEFVMAIRNKFPQYGPAQVFKEAQFWIARGQQMNGNGANGQQPPPQNQGAPPPRLPTPNEMWARPGGSAGVASPNAQYENNPEVLAAVQEHPKYMRMLGKTATPESLASAKQSAIDSIIERQNRQQKGQY